jgi:hypothetical protein
MMNPPSRWGSKVGVAEERNHPWTRKHDDPRTPLLGSVSSIVYPKNLHELIEVCESRRSLKAGKVYRFRR